MDNKTQTTQLAPASPPDMPAAAAAHWSSYLEGPDLSFFPATTAHLEGPPQPTSHVREFDVRQNRSQNQNLATLLRSSWAVVAGTYSGSKDVIFGSRLSTAKPGGGPESRAVVVPTRVRWAPETTVRDLVGSVRAQDDDGAAPEPVGLEAIARASEDAAAACQFTCVFAVGPGPDGGHEEQDIGQQDEHEGGDNGAARALSLQCSYLPITEGVPDKDDDSDMPSSYRLRVTARFDQRALSQAHARRVMTQLERVVRLLSDPASLEQPVSSLPLLSAPDRAEIEAWNAHEPAVARDLAHERVRQQALRRPGHTAVSAWDGAMTYAELDGAAGRLALRLRRLGVGPETLVPISFGKSLWAVVAMLGVLKAGGAFAVLDPAHPAGRKEAIAAQLGAGVAVASASAAALMPPGCVDTILICDEAVRSWPSPSERGGDGGQALLPPPGLGPDNAMYVIFTSGSTGTPKGCVTSHQAFCSSMAAFGKEAGMHADRQVLQFASYSFDTSLEEIFCALMAGATLHVPSEEARVNDLAGVLRRTRADWAELNPKVASLLVPGEVPDLKTIILGGDRSHGSDVARWPATTALMNSYGCTEASVTSTLIPLNGRDPLEEPPIGRGVGCRLWVADPDDHHRLAPVGAPGELLIEGPGLARGYLGDAERTARSFIVDPRWSVDAGGAGGGRRFYKTGDIVRYNDEGAVMYVGRKDSQVKLRGQRVELGEVEHQLSRALPDCRVAAEVPVMRSLYHDHAGDDGAGASGPSQATLAAFIVLPAQDGLDMPSAATASIDLSPAAVDRLLAMRPRLVQDLARSLPGYMVPSIFIPISAMPLTVSAKTDRRKLRALAQGLRPDQVAMLQGRSDPEDADAGNREHKAGLWTEAERQMRDAWAQVLGVPAGSISRGDNFFRVGGDSLAAMKLVPLCRKVGLQISVAEVFRAPELHNLAAAAAAAGPYHDGAGNSDTLSRRRDEGEGAEHDLDVAPFSLLGLDSNHEQTSIEALRREAAEQCGLRQAADIEDMYPCTPLQEGLLALSSRRPGSYVARLAFELAGDVDLAGFHAAWDRVVEAHAILRTRIVSLAVTDSDSNSNSNSNPRLLQAVTRPRLPWETATDLEAYLRRDESRLVEVGAPMTRFAMIPHHGGRYIFVWTLHHCIYDGWSLPLVLRDLRRAYDGLLQPLPVPPFSRFISHLSRQDPAPAAGFWSRYLAGPTSMFPAAPGGEEEDGAAQPDSSLTARTDFPVRAVAGATPATVLRTAWALLTRSYTGVSDVTFGTTVTGRNAPVPGVEDMSGPTIATVPVRVSWRERGGDNDNDNDTATPTTIRELLDGVQRQAAGVIPFEQTGLQHIARASDDARSACRFQALFVVQPADDDDDEFYNDGLMRPLDGNSGPEVGDRARETTQALLVECTLGRAADAPVDIHMSYDSSVVSHPRAASLLARFQHILAQLVALAGEEDDDVDMKKKSTRPAALDTPVADLSLVSAHDTARMAQWNGASDISPPPRTLQDLMAGAAAAYPDRPAVCAWDGDMSFAELAGAAARVARRLGQMDVGKGHGGGGDGGGEEKVVLLCLERSRWAIVSMLAVLQAGAAFVALDPAQPDDRLLSIMRLSGARVLLTSPRLSARLEDLSRSLSSSSSSPTPLRIACAAELAAPSPSPDDSCDQPQRILPAPPPRPGDLAYIIFTSGSTGVPKGVMIEHGAAAASVVAHGAAFGVSAASRTLQFSSLTFDACVFEIFTTLAAGGCVCIPSDAGRVDDLAGAINNLGVNTVMLTPSVLALIDPEAIPGVRSVIFIAEQVTDGDIRRWRGEGDGDGDGQAGRRLLNGYGPTECTVVCVVNRDLRHGGVIGQAVGCRAWVVDPDDHDVLLPTGAAGELLIEGPSLARGYMGDPGRTAASFIYDPAWARSSGGPPRRFYKTGDLVRYTPDEDGSLTYIGRKDTQVKLRGQRVELAEVDHHLRLALPAGAEVRSEVVNLPPQGRAKGSSSGEVAALAAFVVLPGCGAAVGGEEAEGLLSSSSSGLVQFREATQAAAAALTRAVPSYMVPSLFVPVARMPLTVSGKTDRLRLREMASRLTARDLEVLRWGRGQAVAVADDAAGAENLKGSREGNNNDSIKKAPSNEAERAMRAAWASVLRLDDEDIGVEDNFFRLGGDSISAMKLVAAARARGIDDLTVARIFQTPVLGELCGSRGEAAESPAQTDPKPADISRDIVRDSRPQPARADPDPDAIPPFALLPGAAGTVDIDKAREEAARQCGVAPDAVEDLYPCTPLQQGLVSLTAKEGSGSYVMRQVFRLGSTGTISTRALCRAWDQTVRAHPILRTRVVHLQLGPGGEGGEGGGPGALYQAVLSPGQAGLWWRGGETARAGMGTLSEYLAADEKEGGGIGELGSPLCRLALVSDDTGKNENNNNNNNNSRAGDDATLVLVWTIHHAIYDGWTMPILKEAVAEAYEAITASPNTTHELVPSPPFNRFINHLASSDKPAAHAFWTTYLDGATPSPFPATPTARADGLARSYRATSAVEAAYRLWGDRDDDDDDNLNSSSSGAAADVAVSTVLRTAYALVVGAHTGSRDVVFGTTLSGRSAPVAGVEAMTGPTIATVPVRVRWGEDTSPRGLLRRVQVDAGAMMPHEQFGLQRIAALDNGGGGEACRFQSLFVVQPAGDGEGGAVSRLFGEGREVAVRSRHVQGKEEGEEEEEEEGVGGAPAQTYALGIEASVSGGGELRLTATFDEQVLDGVQARRILSQVAHAARLLYEDTSTSSSSADKPLARISLAGPEDMAQILTWNNTTNNNTAVRAVREPIHDLVSRHAASRPSAPAVSAWDGDLTFRELEYLSNGLAHRLRACGVGVGAGAGSQGEAAAVAVGEEHLRGAIVALSLDKSKWVPVAVLAVLKAGGAFVALDPAQPAPRLRLIAKEAGVRVLVTTTSLAGAGINDDVRAASVLCPPDLVLGPDEMARPPPRLPRADGSDPGDALAYVVFTSGSTGVPKGVLVPHAAAASSLLAHGPAMGITPASRVLQFAAYTFDASVLEVLGSLLSGACVCVPSRDECGADLNAAARRYGVTFVALTPRVASLLDPAALPAVTAVALGAETVHPADIQRWGGGRRVSNGYGPTECAVVCVLEARDHRPGRIGRGVGAITWVVDPDDHDRLAPIGAPGELLIEGPCLARGYLNQHDKTAEVFVEDPAWARDMPRPDFYGTTTTAAAGRTAGRTRRFYKTGDLVRYDPDGALVFMGRKDTQVKLRGLRIELGEVEHHLRRLLSECDVAADVVGLPQRGAGDSRAVVAFVAPGRGTGKGAEPNNNNNTTAPSLATDDAATRLVASWADKAAEMGQVLPSYMVPSLLVPMTRLPLTPSGKTDRRVLAAVAAGLTAADLERLQNAQAAREPPRTRSERLMHAAWVRVLGAQPAEVGVHDSFFHLGGESILAMRLVPVAAALGFTSLRVSDVFRTPVLAELCERLPEPECRPDMEGDMGVGLGQDPVEEAGGAHETLPVISHPPSPGDTDHPSPSPPSSVEGSDSSRDIGLLGSGINSNSNSTRLSTPGSATPSKSPSLTPLTDDDTYNISLSIDISNGASTLGQARVAPATDFQALAFEYAHLRRRGFVNYFVLRLRVPVGLGRVHAAATALLLRYSILRTELRIANGRLWQVVAPPAAAAPVVEVYRAGGDSIGGVISDDALPGRIVEMDEARRLGARAQQPVKFFAGLPAGAPAPGPVSCVVLRLAHTHYDGLSFPRVLDTLASSLSDTSTSNNPDRHHHQQGGGAGPPAPAPELSFSDFSLTAQVLPSSRSLAYWRALLSGSALTPVVTPAARAANEGDEGLLTAEIPAPDLGAGGLTFPAVLKAAWAVVLAQHAREADVTFGCMVSGRMPVVPGADAVVGPCVNIVPVRVRVAPDMTTRDLVAAAHAQHVDSMEHEHVGLRRIISQCTAWPARTDFAGASVVQHQAAVMAQSLGALSSGAEGGGGGGGLLPFDLGAQGRNANAAAVWVITTPSPTRDGVLGVELYYARHAVPAHVAHALLRGLCVAVRELGRGWGCGGPLPRTVVECVGDAPVLPCGGESGGCGGGGGGDDGDTDPAAPSPSPSPGQLEGSVVGEAWGRLLKAHPGVRVALGAACSMFDVWDDNLVAVELMGIYEDLGVFLDLEELLRAPTMGAQLLLLRDWC
ncbi:hypothetical protein KVR01_008940 [Diaporthe batatas]|uniref:uncharacterized protein n=1 Tax=Diaporthe batatas TaxID=748121 RepID=UPI001D048950|nr:uncharacterized protein KVR01_008940 [Diaporthe batatas]KAG8160676.1 hypothetical protein KVR01_008940 [Diaporthe batatas]